MSKPDARWDGPGLEAWSGAWTPTEVAAAMQGVAVPWCVVGGWAIDLFLGELTRPHDDLEIAVTRPDHLRVWAHLASLEFRAVGDGEIRALARGEDLPGGVHQSWGLDVDEQAWRVDVMVEPGDHERWICRRDERIDEPRARMIGRSRAGIPYLRPEGALLYKAKAPRPKDEADLAASLPRLDPDQKQWLKSALSLAHPGHPWLHKISSHPATQ